MTLAIFVYAAATNRSVPFDTAHTFASNKRIRELYVRSHNTFGCIPDAKTCPTWDCSASYTANDACPDLTDADDVFNLLNWNLCYDRGLTAYAFKTQVWINSTHDTCDCTASRFRKMDVEYICTTCQPCCTQCASVTV